MPRKKVALVINKPFTGETGLPQIVREALPSTWSVETHLMPHTLDAVHILDMPAVIIFDGQSLSAEEDTLCVELIAVLREQFPLLATIVVKKDARNFHLTDGLRYLVHNPEPLPGVTASAALLSSIMRALQVVHTPT